MYDNWYGVALPPWSLASAPSSSPVPRPASPSTTNGKIFSWWLDIMKFVFYWKMEGNRIGIFDSIQQAAAFEDPRTTILLSPYMVWRIHSRECSRIPMPFMIRNTRVFAFIYWRSKRILRRSDTRRICLCLTTNTRVYSLSQRVKRLAREILKIGSTSQQNVVIVKTQIQSLINKLKEESMKAAQTVQNHIESYHD